MMHTYRRFLSVRYQYTNPIDQQRARGLLLICAALLLVWLVWAPLLVVLAFQEHEIASGASAVATVLFPCYVAAMIALVQTGHLSGASWMFVLGLFAVTVPAVSTLDGPYALYPVVAAVAAGLLLSRTGAGLSAAILAVIYLLAALVQQQLTEPVVVSRAENTTIDLIHVAAISGLVILFLYLFSGAAEHVFERVMRRAGQTHRIALFPTQAQRKDEFSIYVDAIHLARDMGYLFAQIYLADYAGVLTRRVRAGLARTDTSLLTSVSIGEASALAEAASERRFQHVTLADPELRRSHFLPSVNCGLALPIVDGDVLLGVLDVQSNTGAFTQQEIDTLTVLAGQTGVMARDVRVINDLRERLADQEKITDALRQHLLEMQPAALRQGETPWGSYLQRRTKRALGFDFDRQTGQVFPAEDLPPAHEKVMQSGQLEIERAEHEQTLVVPIMLRGEVLGTMSYTVSGAVNERQVEMAQSVASRLALALENKRLLEQTQAQAARERKASDVASQLISATDVNAVLNIAASSFNQALGAVRTSIRLHPEILEEQQTPPGNGRPS